MGDLPRISMHVHIVLYFHLFFFFSVVALEVTANSWDDIGGF